MSKLSLLVNFIGVDKMSGALRNIVGLGRNGSTSLRALAGEAKKLDRALAKVRRELEAGSGNVTELADRERQLEESLAGTNRQLEQRRRLAAINADQRAMAARGDDLKTRGGENMAGGAMLAAPLVLAVKSAADFSSGMVDIQQKAGLTNRAADELTNRIVAMGQAARQLPEGMRAGLDVLLAKGMKLDAAEAAIAPAARLATAYKVELPDAAGAAYASISNLKVAASDTGRIMDVMAAAGNAGAFEVRDMARSFPSLTAQMQALGEKGVPAVADLSAALQVAMNTAGSSDEAANNISNLLGKINSPETIAKFKKNFGVDLPAAMKTLTDQGHSSLEAIALITQQATGGDTKKLGFLFEDEQARMGLLALIQNMDQYLKIRNDALNSEGTVNKAFDQRVARDASVQWQAFIGTATSLGIVLGTTLLPVMNEMLAHLSGAASNVAEWAKAHPEAAGFIMKTVGALAAFRIGLGALQFGFGALLGPFGNVMAFFRKVDGISRFGTVLTTTRSILSGFAGGAVKAFGLLRTASLFLAQGVMRAGAMMLANPIVLAITAIVLAVGAAAYLIYSNWDRIKGAFVNGWAAVKAELAGAPEWLRILGRMMMDGLLGAINPMALAIKLIAAAKNAIAGFRDYLGIKSPSRVMMAMGGHVSDGLALGIDKGSAAPMQAMGRMSAGVARAGQIALTPIRPARMATPGSAPGAGGAALGATGAAVAASGPVTIHVYGAAGQDVRQLAREVKRELDHLDGVKRRSTYSEAA